MFLPDDPAEPLSLRYLLAFVAAGHGMNEAELEEALYRAGCGSLRLALVRRSNAGLLGEVSRAFKLW